MTFSPPTAAARRLIISATLLALFLGALDALIMSAAMPTIIADLGGLHLYAWTYTAYFLARAVSLPLFGKLSDLYSTKRLFLFSIGLFVLASLAAGVSPSMGFLVAARIFQGMGGGGIFALVYVVLSDISAPDDRARTLSLAASIWGIASLIGPTLGGFIVTWFSWRWIFYINLPLGLLSLTGVGLYFKELRKKPATAHLDLAGAAAMVLFIPGLLLIIMTGGRDLAWTSLPMLLICLITCGSGIGLLVAEKKAKDPIFDFQFFRYPGFAMGNLLVFLASFSIFSLFAYTPLFLQGSLLQSPLQVGYVMLSLSLGWSTGSLVAGRNMHAIGLNRAAVTGAVLMVGGTGLTLLFSRTTPMIQCFLTFLVVGLGMGFMTLSTLLIVQNSVPKKNLGVATSFHQFARTMGGTIGVGLCGAMVTTRLISRLSSAGSQLPDHLIGRLQQSLASLFEPDFQALVPGGVEILLQNAVLNAVFSTFSIVFGVSLMGLGITIFLSRKHPA
jgi:EmrB/QacA subfamily drug resistance transporter